MLTPGPRLPRNHAASCLFDRLALAVARYTHYCASPRLPFLPTALNCYVRSPTRPRTFSYRRELLATTCCRHAAHTYRYLAANAVEGGCNDTHRLCAACPVHMRLQRILSRHILFCPVASLSLCRANNDMAAFLAFV